MSERDRAAVRIHAREIELEVARDREHLRGEGFVQLDEVDVGDFHLLPLEDLPHRRHGPDPHDRGVHALVRPVDETGDRL